jgi:hypothetical protein
LADRPLTRAFVPSQTNEILLSVKADDEMEHVAGRGLAAAAEKAVSPVESQSVLSI